MVWWSVEIASSFHSTLDTHTKKKKEKENENEKKSIKKKSQREFPATFRSSATVSLKHKEIVKIYDTSLSVNNSIKGKKNWKMAIH